MTTTSFIVQIMAAMWLITLSTLMTNKGNVGLLRMMFWKTVPAILAVAITLSAFKII